MRCREATEVVNTLIIKKIVELTFIYEISSKLFGYLKNFTELCDEVVHRRSLYDGAISIAPLTPSKQLSPLNKIHPTIINMYVISHTILI